MTKRFVSAVAIASIVIFVGAIILQLNPNFAVDSRYLLTTIWCMVPLIWGLWALLAPKSWLPKHIPIWGAILGLIAGVTVVFALDIPARFFNEPISNLLRGGLVIAAVVLYYLLWLFVRRIYTSIS